MTASIKMRAHVTGAVLAAFTFRMFFVLQLPFSDAGDTPIYDELARNWLHHGIYGLNFFGHLQPVDIRTPGYPAFLAAIYSLFGESARAVMVAQAGLDTLTCVLAAMIAALLAPPESRRRVFLIALWLTALCPFTANYTGVVLTETLTTFLTTLALLVFIEAIEGATRSSGTFSSVSQSSSLSGNVQWLLVGIVVGMGTLVRPETPLILAAAGVTLVMLWLRSEKRIASLPRFARAGVLMAVGLLLPLLPWAARNWRTLHEAQFLSPRYSQLPGEFVPRGFYAWTDTWLWRMRDVFNVSWNLDSDEITIDDVPPSAFDSSAERTRVAALLARYNETRNLDQATDREFAEIARARAADYPLRTYVEIPALRAFTIWFAPRIEVLSLSGDLWPIAEAWDNDRLDFSVSLAFAILCVAYVLMGLWGAWRRRANPATLLIVAYLVIRTGFLTTIETPEPRYVIECFPALLALAAQALARRSGVPMQFSGEDSL